MFMPYEDPVVQQKHQTQKEILREAGGDLRKYNELIHRKAQKLRDKYPGCFKPVSNEPTLVA
jgi:hypothetical protein